MKKDFSTIQGNGFAEEVFALLKRYDQGDLIDYWRRLSRQKQDELLKDLNTLDLPLAFDLFHRAATPKPSSDFPTISPAPVIPIPGTKAEKARRQKARLVGEELIRKNQVAVLIVAGGQGSRLGFSGPKGKFPITPVKKKSLFQLFAETIRALNLRYEATLPLLIMTSPENHEETREFFEVNNFFGLSPKEVYFFDQGMLPTLTVEGKIVLKDETHILTNPDGHGGSLKALHTSGLLKKLINLGYTELFYCQVDNPLVRIADPVFIGYHRLEGAEISTKVVRRTELGEKVGILGIVKGKPGIVEYSDFPPGEYQTLDETGRPRHWAGNTAIHMISFNVIVNLNRHGFALPYHRAVKKIEYFRENSKKIEENGIKFEAFVFDTIPLAEKTCILEVVREEEFAPVKNRDGIDSPATAEAALTSLYQGWLRDAGIETEAGVRVEISPLFALDREGLTEKLKGEKLVVEGDVYLE